MELQSTTFLHAIQAVPGETPGEKLHSISKFVSTAVQNGQPMLTVIENYKLPLQFLPLCEIEAAKITKNYHMITEALKCEDELISKRALAVNSFYDGTVKEVTNVDYFMNNILPYVSLKTRLGIIKKLAYCLNNNPKLASEFFNMFHEMYGLEQALLLLVACSEDFIYTTVVDKKIILPRKIMKILYRRNANLVIRYLKLVVSYQYSNTRNVQRCNWNDYSDFLASLVRKNLKDFLEIMEGLSDNRPLIKLSNNRARSFLKNGKHHLIDNPNVYFHILPLELIDAEIMKIVLPKLLPEKRDNFRIDKQLDRLHHFPEKVKLPLVMESYELKYGKCLLDDLNNVTPKLMMILPADMRIQQARIKIKEEENHTENKSSYFEREWRCYLPVNETIPTIKEEISKTSEMENRSSLLKQMIYTCKVNCADTALLDVLNYFHIRHRNEQSWLVFEFLDNLVDLYDLETLSNEHSNILKEIIQRMYIKGEMITRELTMTKLMESFLHCRIVTDLPIQETIEILAETRAHNFSGNWNILTKFPNYERTCLEACINYVLQKCEMSTNTFPWKTTKNQILIDILSSIYEFNKQHAKDIKSGESLSLSQYPSLKEAIQKVAMEVKTKDHWYYNRLKTLIREHEPILYEEWFEVGEDSTDLSTGRVLALLKKNPKHIMENWKKYLEFFKQHLYMKATVQVIKAIRWYNDLPIRWYVECQKQVTDSKNSSALWLLGILLDGPSFSILVKPFMPKSQTIETESNRAKEDYDLTERIPRAMKFVNPPPPLEDLQLFCQGDYTSVGLKALTNVCRRSSVDKVYLFAKGLTDQRVSVRKHGIRLIYMIAPINDLSDFLFSKWKAEDHHSIRELLFGKMYDLFLRSPSTTTWASLKKSFLDLSLKDESILSTAMDFSSIPNEYIAEYIKLLFDFVNSLDQSDLYGEKTVDHVCRLLFAIDYQTCNFFSQEFCQELLRKFFFHSNSAISQAAKHFALNSYILCHTDEMGSRIIAFSNIFIDQVSKKWNLPHPKIPHFYPVNYIVHDFVNNLTLNYTQDNVNLHLIDAMLHMFESVVTPKMDAMSYLLLVFAKEQLQSKTPREFGVRIGNKLEELFQIYSVLIISFIRSALQQFLESNLWSKWDGNEVKLSVIEGLLEIKNDYTYVIAAEMLSFGASSKEYVNRYNNVIHTLKKYEQPAVTSIVCNTINSIRL